MEKDKPGIERVVLQPNGLYARFDVPGAIFAEINRTRAEIAELLIRRCTFPEIKAQMQRAEQEPDWFFQGIDAVRSAHGQVEAMRLKALMCVPSNGHSFPVPHKAGISVLRRMTRRELTSGEGLPLLICDRDEPLAVLMEYHQYMTLQKRLELALAAIAGLTDARLWEPSQGNDAERIK